MVRFSAVGDVAFGDHPLCVGFGVRSRLGADRVASPFVGVMGQFRRADLLFGNLECTLSVTGLNAHDYRSVQMRGCPALLEQLKDAGFTVLNVANNHSLQHGEQPFRETCAMLESRGIRVCGVRAVQSSGSEPVYVETKGLRVAFLGYSLRPRQYFSREPLYAEGSLRSIADEVARIRQSADTVVVSLHWGEEFVRRPSPEEIHIAREIVDAGADLVLGHHPHIVRAIEEYHGSYIAYSLGNFVCDMTWDERLRESIIFSCELTDAGPRNLEIQPVHISEDYRPEIMGEPDSALFLEELKSLALDLGFREEGAARGAIYDRAYEREARAAMKIVTLKSRLHFLRSIGRYPPRLLLQQVERFLRCRYDRLLGRERLPDLDG
ncbi:MAG TPA: CapA family protein [Candidatus Methanoperedens sp.]|nr:CapA family protein [Candidatus Methanoperedens sp.]